jgi:hypothetical protein
MATLSTGRTVACATSGSLDANRRLRGCVLARDERVDIAVGSRQIVDIPCAGGAMARFDGRGNLEACTLSTDRSFADHTARPLE